MGGTELRAQIFGLFVFFFGAESVDDEVGKQTNKITSHKKDGRFKNQAQNELLTERNISKSSILKILDFFLTCSVPF